MKLKERIEELERKVRELEARPAHFHYPPVYLLVPMPYYQPTQWPQPYFNPPTWLTSTAWRGAQFTAGASGGGVSMLGFSTCDS
jgi:hypothetical protein